MCIEFYITNVISSIGLEIICATLISNYNTIQRTISLHRFEYNTRMNSIELGVYNYIKYIFNEPIPCQPSNCFLYGTFVSFCVSISVVDGRRSNRWDSYMDRWYKKFSDKASSEESGSIFNFGPDYSSYNLSVL